MIDPPPTQVITVGKLQTNKAASSGTFQEPSSLCKFKTSSETFLSNDAAAIFRSSVGWPTQREGLVGGRALWLAEQGQLLVDWAVAHTELIPTCEPAEKRRKSWRGIFLESFPESGVKRSVNYYDSGFIKIWRNSGSKVDLFTLLCSGGSRIFQMGGAVLSQMGGRTSCFQVKSAWNWKK